jgi:DNA-binding transcriptional MocR family regulator
MGLARYYNVFILEDDYISDLSYSKDVLAPLKALDRDDRVIYLKSFSKIFMPGLRLAFLTMPKVFAAKLLNVKHLSDISTSGLTQRAFDLYLRQGIWQKHLAEIKQTYQIQFEFTLQAIAKYLPKDVHFIKPNGGLSIWFTLPPTVSAKNITELAHQNGVLLTEGSPFFPRQTSDQHIRISFATIRLQEITAGMQIIGKAIEAHL